MISLNLLSSAEGFLYSGISPSKNLWVNVKVLCKKLPITSANSSLFLLWKSSHEKSVSLFKGAFIVK